MRKKGHVGRCICMAIATVTLTCTSVFPVYAETNVGQSVQEKAQNVETKTRVAANEPILPEENLVWSTKNKMEIPVQNLKLNEGEQAFLYVEGDTQYQNGYPLELQGDKLLLTMDNHYFAWDAEKKVPAFFRTKGKHSVYVEVKAADNTKKWTSDSFSIQIEEDSQIWETPSEQQSVSGKEDFNFSFKNGTGRTKVVAINRLEFRVSSSARNGKTGRMISFMTPPDFTLTNQEGYAVDLDKGVVTIDIEQFNEKMKEWEAKQPAGTKPHLGDIAAYATLPDGEKLVFNLEFGVESAFVSWQLDFTDYNPDVQTEEVYKLTSGTWTGKKDIVIGVQAKGKTVWVNEVSYLKDDKRLGVADVIADVQIDTASGKGTITVKNDVLKNAKNKNGTKIDWTKADKLQVEIVTKTTGTSGASMVSVDVPVSFYSSESVGTVTLKDNSGVSMELPKDEAEGLSLKVSESNGAEEKEAVSKLVQVAGNKIKTFDLSLLLNGKVWEYNGQFKSQVTLPIPEGWNLDLLALYYYDEVANKAVAVPFTVDKINRTLTFETNHFSRFVLVEKVADNTNSDITKADKNPKTGDTSNVSLYMVMLFVAGTAIIVVERKRKA